MESVLLDYCVHRCSSHGLRPFCKISLDSSKSSAARGRRGADFELSELLLWNARESGTRCGARRTAKLPPQRSFAEGCGWFEMMFQCQVQILEPAKVSSPSWCGGVLPFVRSCVSTLVCLFGQFCRGRRDKRGGGLCSFTMNSLTKPDFLQAPSPSVRECNCRHLGGSIRFWARGLGAAGKARACCNRHSSVRVRVHAN